MAVKIAPANKADSPATSHQPWTDRNRACQTNVPTSSGMPARKK